jgi:hypothetical protein
MEGMMDKFIISGGAGCDMTFFNNTVDGEAFIHHVNGQWLFDKKVYWSWLRPLANAGMSLHRIFLYCVGGKRKRSECFMPWQFVPASDAWDLRVKNQPFFDILRQQVVEANKMKTQVMVCIMNECEERKAERKEQSPFYHNINDVDGLYDRKALPFIAELTGWILEALQGTDFAIELINEGHRRGSGSADAVNAMLPKLIAADVKPWNISLGADILDTPLAGFRDVSDWKQRWPNELQPPDRENYDIFIDRNHLVKYYDAKYPNATHEVFYLICHNFADKADKEYPDIFPYGRRTGYAIEAGVDRNLANNRVCFSTDGTDNADAPSGRPSPERWKAAMLYVMRHNKRYKDSPLIDGRPKLWFDFLPGGESIPNIVKIMDAANEAHVEMFGEPLENRGKVPTYEQTYPDIVPIPDPITPDPITPDEPKPVKPPINWLGEWRNNWKWIVGGTIALIVLAILIF